MKENKILTKRQLLFLSVFSQEKELSRKFYLSGGTALTEFYISYRLSEDLDFFSFEEVDAQVLSIFLKKHQKEIGFKSVEFNTSFNRNLFFLKYSNEILKTEFTYYPFTQLEKPLKKDGVFVDSLIDIATNKLFTIYQKPRARDFMDLFMICSEKGYKITDLVEKARLKFDTHIDPIKLGSQFLLCQKVKDYPTLLIDLPDDKWQQFFLDEAKKIGKEILE